MPVASSNRAAATAEVWSRPCTARSTQLAAANSSHTTQTTTAVGERNVWTVRSARPRFWPPAGAGPGAVPGRAPGGVLLRGDLPEEEGEPPDEGLPDGWLAAMLPDCHA